MLGGAIGRVLCPVFLNRLVDPTTGTWQARLAAASARRCCPRHTPPALPHPFMLCAAPTFGAVVSFLSWTRASICCERDSRVPSPFSLRTSSRLSTPPLATMHTGDRSVEVWSTEGPMALTEQMKIMPRNQLTTHRPIEEPREHRFSPYEFNGGTSVGIAGKDFAVIAADTRLSSGYSILSRNESKATVLNDACVMATGGCRTDVITLHKNITTRIHQYRLAHEDSISCTAVAQMLSNTLYYRRFFPFYAFNIVAGVDSEGKGAIFTYDAIGSFERTMYAAQGSGQKLIIPVLDNLIGYKNREQPKPDLTVEETVEIIKDSFITAGERNIYTGDSVEIFIMTKAGLRKEVFDLKAD